MARPAALALIAVLALVAPAGARAGDRCPHRTGERELARSAQAVVTERRRATIHTVLGCARATGRRRVIVADQQPDLAPSGLAHGFRLTGTRVAYLVDTGSSLPGSESTRLLRDDAVQGGDVHVLAQTFGTAQIRPYRVAADGSVAWIEHLPTGDRLRLWRDGPGWRTVDSGFGLSGPLTLVAGRLGWRHRGAPLSASIVLPPDACPRGRDHDGTAAVDLQAGPGSLTACDRETGTTVTTAASAADVAGRFVAAVSTAAVIRIDLAAGTAETIPVTGYPSAVIDASGSMAWTDYVSGDPRPSRLWVRDAHGTRIAASSEISYISLARDDRTVVAPGGPTVVLDP